MRIRIVRLCIAVSAGIGLLGAERGAAVPPPGARTAQGQVLQSRTPSAELASGSAPRTVATSGFDASGVTLLSHVSYTEFGGGSFESQDCWGYVSPSGREYAIIGNSHGVGFAEVTDPSHPVVIAEISHSPSLTSDMKVYGEYCYAVNGSGGGLQVIDLRQIDAGLIFEAPANPREFVRAHNLALNTDTAYAYPCGTSPIAGFLAYDLTDPDDPKTSPSWIWNAEYVHDLHPVQYEHCPYGDPAASCEIAYAFCGGAGLRIIDITDKNQRNFKR